MPNNFLARRKKNIELRKALIHDSEVSAVYDALSTAMVQLQTRVEMLENDLMYKLEQLNQRNRQRVKRKKDPPMSAFEQEFQELLKDSEMLDNVTSGQIPQTLVGRAVGQEQEDSEGSSVQ